MAKFKYNPGDIQNQCKLISRDYKDSNGNWYCTFQCLECGNIINKRTDSLLNYKGLACPVCLKSISTGELLLEKIFNKLNIKYEHQKSFNTCRFPNTNKLARFDFYLPDFNILIEYNGEQHYRNSGWQTEEKFKSTQYRDKYKIQWCKENDISLIIIPYTVNLSIDYIKSILYKE